MIEKERIKKLNSKDILKNGRYGLYIMQASQRLSDNKALAFAVSLANENNIPLITVFNIMPSFPGANIRHYAFMIEGLKELKKDFDSAGYPFYIMDGYYEENFFKISGEAAFAVTDCGYLRHQREMRERAAQKAEFAFYQVEADTAIPCETASQKKEPYASVLRPKILKLLPYFLKTTKIPELKNKKKFVNFKNINICEKNFLESFLKCPLIPGPVIYEKGGYREACEKLKKFISKKLNFYHLRSDPSSDYSSGLSAYLHFGQISPCEISLSVLSSKSAQENKQKFLDELIVWRELARNFTLYEKSYDSLKGLPEWALLQLSKRSSDERPYLYSKEELEKARTKDIYWNCAQKELLIRGRIHNYMRMYWGKKIIEWTDSPQKAAEIMIYLNDKYALDGRDPNGYASILWCFGLHDRPFFPRPIFGNIRYMSAKGLETKFDMDKYVSDIEYLEKDFNKNPKRP
ncbi:MAG: deoxyribodipyrimidine photo-lyase [Elusimicrobiota bacterium]